jgi:hypothetical protein
MDNNRIQYERILIFLWLALILNQFAPAQTCPATLGQHYRLVITDAKPSGKITYTEKDGVKIGSMACHYEADPTWMKSGVQLNWVEQAPQLTGRAILEMTCYPFTSPATFSSATKQARASIIGWANEDHRKELATIALNLIKETEPRALPCPGLVQDEIQRNNNMGRAVKGKLIKTDGFIEIFDPVRQQWIHHVNGTEAFIYAGQKVATRSDAKCTIVIVNNTGEEELVELGSHTIFSMTDEGGLFSPVINLFKGLMKYYHKRNQALLRKLPRVVTPTVIIEPEGTEFLLHHDEITKADIVLLKEGKMQITAGNIKKELTANRQIAVQNGNFSQAYPLNNNLWNDVIAGTVKPGYESIVQAEVEIEKKINSRYSILFNNKIYNCIYQKHATQDAVPIDVYYYEFTGSNGFQVMQDGEALFNRFVRVPAEIHTDQSNVEWWHFTWQPDGNRWSIRGTIVTGVKILN